MTGQMLIRTVYGGVERRINALEPPVGLHFPHCLSHISGTGWTPDLLQSEFPLKKAVVNTTNLKRDGHLNARLTPLVSS